MTTTRKRLPGSTRRENAGCCNEASTTISEGLAAGDVVRLRPGVRDFDGQLGPSFDNQAAAITSFLRDVKGGIYIQSGLRGCRYWNIADVEKI